ncbi:lytic murein transglycosylase [Tranquillimonas alkanivorans]|uniref:Lytic murein transglycosylase n=1 Tax=Tranquillimonas alkanivorans TaxID=441119 RepID=A0A1I5L2Z7_9RHOB|nr:lytic murein transglycosylase [Tranquillimonas alkanivorans]SFO91532.1 lytic murein transglycosylase [Tranquillimonas alkanivorans]
MRTLVGLCGLGLIASLQPASAAPPEQSVRPQPRAAQTTAAAETPKARPAELAEEAQLRLSTMNIAFERWIRDFRGRALAQGIDDNVFDRALGDVRYNTDVIQRDRNQSEFTKTIWDYLDSAASATRVENGRAALREHAALLDEIEATYGVEKEVVVAVWGLESAYGTFRGSTPTIEALATLAYDGRRGRFFEAQLVAALQIVQAGDVEPGGMTGSWAGAMGHTQFIPTSYLTYAVDHTGDGKRDIWSDDPADALASTAAYLERFGWTKGQPWGVEVRLPEGFDYALADRDTTKSPSDWAALGVVGTDGRAVPDHGTASILLPAGARGAAFMIFDNFGVIERYNTADAYVIGVGHLSDRLAGAGPIEADWPRGDRALTFAERKEMQSLLTRRGFDTQGVDGRVGPRTIAAIRGFQRRAGMVPDGYASLRLLDRLRLGDAS